MRSRIPVLVKLLILLGLLGNLGLVALGFLWVIPRFGAVGVAWTILLIGIALYNTYQFVLRPSKRS